MSIGVKSNISTGRGGAGKSLPLPPNYSHNHPSTNKPGNIGSSKLNKQAAPRDLQTPTIKRPTFSTGRGGSANIIKGDAERSRHAQDLGGTLRRNPKSGTKILTGRGGGGNTVVIQEEEEGSEGENERVRKVKSSGNARRSEEAPRSVKVGFVGRMKRRVSGVGRGQRQGSVVTV
ncbi:MAG: hypothetical protein Q9162_000688 [Coniocarpon cinnabarinum]